MATHPGANGTGMFSAVEGVLELQDGCLLIRAEDGTTLVPVFPDESVEWDDENQSVVADGTNLVLGTKYELGGGSVDGRPVDGYVPTECPDDLRYFVVGHLPPG